MRGRDAVLVVGFRLPMFSLEQIVVIIIAIAFLLTMTYVAWFAVDHYFESRRIKPRSDHWFWKIPLHFWMVRIMAPVMLIQILYVVGKEIFTR